MEQDPDHQFQQAEGPASLANNAEASDVSIGNNIQQMLREMHAASEASARETEARQITLYQTLQTMQTEITALKRQQHLPAGGENPETSANNRENPETSSSRRENTETSTEERDPVTIHGRNRNSFAMPFGLPTMESAPRPKEPDTFSGNRAKLNSFENQICSYIKMCPHYFADEERKVR